MSDRFEEFHFPLFYGAQNRRSELWTIFAQNRDCIVCSGFLCLIIWNKERVGCSLKRCRFVEKGGHLAKLTMTHDQYHLLIDGSCNCLVYQQGACGPRGHFLWLENIGPFEEHLFCEASQETSRKARARMLRAEGIRVPVCGSSPFGWERGLVFTTVCLKFAEQRLFYICASFRMRGLYRNKSFNELVVIGTTANIEVCSRISR